MGDNNSFSVDTEGLSHVIPDVENLAMRIRSIGTQLQGKLSALGECWGEDKNGEQFLSQYLKPKEDLVEGITSSGEVLDSTVEGIYTMAKQYDRLEQENMLALQRLKVADPDVDITGGSGGGSGSGGDGTQQAQLRRTVEKEPMRALRREAEEPLQPTRMMRATRREAEVPAEPLMPLRGEELGRLTPAEPAIPAIPATETARLMPMERGELSERIPAEPAIPAEPRQAETPVQPFLRATRREAEVPAEPLMPLRGEELGRLTPAEPAIPAIPATETARLMPMERGELSERIPAEPAIPAEPRQFGTSTQPLRPMEPLQPMERGELIPQTPDVPAQPRHLLEDGTVVPDQPREFSRAVPATEGLPAGHLMPQQPVTPAVPETPAIPDTQAVPADGRVAPLEPEMPAHRLEPVESDVLPAQRMPAFRVFERSEEPGQA
jgi:hypothetical protein